MTNKIEINGINYKVEKIESADDMVKSGHKNTARMMREVGIAFQMVLTRPRGKRFYHCNAYANGTFSKPFAIA